MERELIPEFFKTFQTTLRTGMLSQTDTDSKQSLRLAVYGFHKGVFTKQSKNILSNSTLPCLPKLPEPPHWHAFFSFLCSYITDLVTY